MSLRSNGRAPRKRVDRRVYAIEEMTPEQVATLRHAEVPAEYDYLNAELKDLKPDQPG